MKKIPTIAFYPAHNDRTSALITYVRHNGKTYKHSTGMSINPDHWDSGTQKVLRREPRWTEYNLQLNRIYRTIEQALRSPRATIDKAFWNDVDTIVADGTPATHENKSYLYEYIIQTFIPRAEKRMNLKRLSRFTRLADLIKDYEKTYHLHLSFEDITLAFYRQFQDWFYNKGYTGNYFGTIVKILKQVMGEAGKIDNLHSNYQYTTSEFRTVVNTVDNIYLTPEEIEKIYRLPINTDLVRRFHPAVRYGIDSVVKTYQICKDRFLLGCGTGLRVSDYNRLTQDNIQGDNLVVIAQKTKQRVVIPLSTMVKDILQHYDWESKLSEQKIRYYIKDICQAAGINNIVEVRKDEAGKVVIQKLEKYKLVSTHTARRSFATNAYKAGIPALQICRLTGHTSERALLNYIKITNEENAELLRNNPFFQ